MKRLALLALTTAMLTGPALADETATCASRGIWWLVTNDKNSSGLVLSDSITKGTAILSSQDGPDCAFTFNKFSAMGKRIHKTCGNGACEIKAVVKPAPDEGMAQEIVKLISVQACADILRQSDGISYCQEE